jgi:hypothetical protein
MVMIVTKTPDGRSVQGKVRPVHAWAWLHTLRTGNDPENMQQVLDWAREEMVKANLSEEVIGDMITNEIANIVTEYNNQLGPKPELEMDTDPDPLETA